MFKKETNTFLNLSLFIITSVVVFYVLYIWSSLIIPFIIAVLFSFAIIWLSNYYKGFKFPSFVSFPLSLLTYIFIFWLIWKMIGSNVSDLSNLMPVYEESIRDLMGTFLDYFPASMETSLSGQLKNINFTQIFTWVFDTVTSIFWSAWIILFYVMFILLEYRYFKEKLNLMISDNTKKKEVFEILEKIKTDIKSYFVIKTFVSLLTATISYLVMLAFWLDFAIFWAFLIFILNFIPNVWSIMAVFFPVILSLIQPEFSLYDSLFMITGLIWTQVIMWNIVEPKFMGNKLNLSPLVIIISLGFWGSLWGIIGMLLSVPLMVIINIILWKIPATRPIAILLSEKWELQVDWWEEVIKTRKKIISRVKEKLVKRK